MGASRGGSEKGRRHSRERELPSRGVWGEIEHSVFPEPSSGVWVCAGWGSSPEMGAGEVGGNQMTMTSKALGRRL